MNFKPLHDRLLVRRLEQDEKTQGGILLPESAKEKPAEGEVVVVGPGSLNDAGQRRPMDIKAGERILFAKWAGTEVKIDGKDYLVIKEADVLGILA